jgi:hypothetical protein
MLLLLAVVIDLVFSSISVMCEISERKFAQNVVIRVLKVQMKLKESKNTMRNCRCFKKFVKNACSRMRIYAINMLIYLSITLIYEILRL